MSTKVDYYTRHEISAWERIKKALANDWEQTKSDCGLDTARDIDQVVDDTIKQMSGCDDAFENREQAFRFGYTAQTRYKDEYPSWNDDLDAKLRSEYAGDYDTHRRFIRHAYAYRS